MRNNHQLLMSMLHSYNCSTVKKTVYNTVQYFIFTVRK
jgi:hypothetical protein